MAGTKSGGLKSVETNKRLYGDDFYKRQGAKGGLKGNKDGAIKGFAAATPEQRREWGSMGGKISKRVKTDIVIM